jgi:hypothetical protein
MKNWMLLAGLGFGGLTAVMAAEPFSRQVTPEQFRAAGLEKLSPEELARLDALVQGYRVAPGGRETTAPRPVAKAPAAPADAEAAESRVAAAEARARLAEQAAAAAKEAARAAQAEQKRAEEGFLTKAKRVLLTPGTEITYEKVETQLTPPFRGYEPGTVLMLSNGQRWAVIDGQYWGPRSEENRTRRVIIEPGVLGSFYLRIEGAGRPKVKFLSGP